MCVGIITCDAPERVQCLAPALSREILVAFLSLPAVPVQDGDIAVTVGYRGAPVYLTHVSLCSTLTCPVAPGPARYARAV